MDFYVFIYLFMTALNKHLCLQHEAVKNELNDRQEELDAFTNKGKHLLAELKRIHNFDPILVKTDMNSTVDKWLDVRTMNDVFLIRQTQFTVREYVAMSVLLLGTENTFFFFFF